MRSYYYIIKEHPKGIVGLSLSPTQACIKLYITEISQ